MSPYVTNPKIFGSNFFHKLLLIKAKMYRTNSLMKYHSLLKMKKKYNELNTDIKKIEKPQQSKLHSSRN